MVLYRRAQCAGTGGKSTVYLYTEYRKVYIRYLGLKFRDMSRRLRSIYPSTVFYHSVTVELYVLELAISMLTDY